MQALRLAHLAEHPQCQWTDCPKLAVEVDHMTPLAEGGRRYDPRNFQSLCDPHHKAKTNADALRGKTRPR